MNGMWMSSEGAYELSTMRVGWTQPAVVDNADTAPIRLLFRGPSDECGCPEELWLIDGIQYLIHFEPNGFAEIHVYAGDVEKSMTCRGMGSMDQLRADMFAYHAKLPVEGEEEPVQYMNDAVHSDFKMPVPTGVDLADADVIRTSGKSDMIIYDDGDPTDHVWFLSRRAKK